VTNTNSSVVNCQGYVREFHNVWKVGTLFNNTFGTLSDRHVAYAGVNQHLPLHFDENVYLSVSLIRDGCVLMRLLCSCEVPLMYAL
jgi:hypothetical protein